MAVETGTATDYADLFTRLRTFLTTNAELVAAGQNWTELAHKTDGTYLEESYLRGPGLSGTDEIYVQVGRQESLPGDWFNWVLAGGINYEPLNSWGNQAGKSSNVVLTLWNSAIPYWFIANGRRFIVVAKVSTVYVAAYAGLILPYATSTEYPYPIYIGANSPSDVRWSNTSSSTGNFWDCAEGSAFMRHVDGTWYPVRNTSTTGGLTWPWTGFTRDYIDFPITDMSGGHPLMPAIILNTQFGGLVAGEFDGVFHTTGYGTASENIITADGTPYLVVQNVFRTGRQNYAAIKLE